MYRRRSDHRRPASRRARQTPCRWHAPRSPPRPMIRRRSALLALRASDAMARRRRAGQPRSRDRAGAGRRRPAFPARRRCCCAASQSTRRRPRWIQRRRWTRTSSAPTSCRRSWRWGAATSTKPSASRGWPRASIADASAGCSAHPGHASRCIAATPRPRKLIRTRRTARARGRPVRYALGLRLHRSRATRVCRAGVPRAWSTRTRGRRSACADAGRPDAARRADRPRRRRRSSRLRCCEREMPRPDLLRYRGRTGAGGRPSPSARCRCCAAPLAAQPDDRATLDSADRGVAPQGRRGRGAQRARGRAGRGTSTATACGRRGWRWSRSAATRSASSRAGWPRCPNRCIALDTCRCGMRSQTRRPAGRARTGAAHRRAATRDTSPAQTADRRPAVRERPRRGGRAHPVAVARRPRIRKRARMRARLARPRPGSRRPGTPTPSRPGPSCRPITAALRLPLPTAGRSPGSGRPPATPTGDGARRGLPVRRAGVGRRTGGCDAAAATSPAHSASTAPGPKPPNDPLQVPATAHGLCQRRADPAQMVARTGARRCPSAARCSHGEVIDWLLWWDNALLRALRTHLPEATVAARAARSARHAARLVALRLARAPRCRSPLQMAQWLAAMLEQLSPRWHERRCMPHRLLRMDDIATTPQAIAARWARRWRDMPMPPAPALGPGRFRRPATGANTPACWPNRSRC